MVKCFFSYCCLNRNAAVTAIQLVLNFGCTRIQRAECSYTSAPLSGSAPGSMMPGVQKSQSLLPHRGQVSWHPLKYLVAPQGAVPPWVKITALDFFYSGCPVFKIFGSFLFNDFDSYSSLPWQFGSKSARSRILH